MTKLIVNADDFGYSKGVNYGIIEAHLNGIVNSATMMMNMYAVEHGIELAKLHPTLGLGVHLVLTAGKPLLTGLQTIVDQNGDFLKNSYWYDNPVINVDEVEKEWDAQIQKFLSYGLNPSHLDSHHHVHMIPILHPVIAKLSQKYNLPVRISPKSQIDGITPFTDQLLTDFYGSDIPINYFETIEDRINNRIESVEVMVHPALIDNYLKNGTSYCFERLTELDILTNSKLPEGVELVKY
ncbi:chitin disaccharide deacetylase [Gottfriedia acidiceleris]|uniref:chitin disaccharide deacetylase n=1 Tax=Bacillaceae TaxID=186817 RepID=UPI000BEB8E99|nr:MULTISPECIES: chitin disaccharide deacetylase [unclassified Bacillus (in: firmicutes)]PEC51666.1 chitin disaccharide deacetylase [Bacillus sp. AFS096315]PFM81796.1 chitin disaccharide deacetylase [Bacillus sp. AFS077874]